MDRRQFLVTTGALTGGPLLAGCSGGPEIPDISVYNETGREITVTVVVTLESSGEVVLDETQTMATTTQAGASLTFRDPVSSAGTHTVVVTVDGGPSDELDWEVPGNSEDGQDEAVGLDVHIGDEAVEFTHVAA